MKKLLTILILLILNAIVLATNCRVTVYSNYFHGRKTASGEVFSQQKMTCAVPRHLFRRLKGKYLTITYKKRTIKVKVNDVCGTDAIDLSKAAWNKLTDGSKPSSIRAVYTTN